MKKVLVGTCVLAMTAFGITNASADPISSARASAFGISIDLLGSELVDQEPEVTSEFPPGGSEEEDVVTIDAEELVLQGVGIQQAETSGESNLTPMLVSDGEDSGSSGSGILQTQQLGGGGEDEEGSDLLGLNLDEILNNLGGDDEEGGEDGGTSGIEGFGGPDDDDIEIPNVNARALSSISITGVAIDDEGGEDGGEGGNDFLGVDLEELLGLGGDSEGESSDTSALDGVTGQSAGDAGTVQIQQSEGGDDLIGDLLGSSGDELQEIVFEALLRLGLIESEAVAVCTNNEVRFDVASRLADGDGSDIDLGDLIDDLISELIGGEDGDEALLEELLSGLIDTEEGEVGTTEDGGVFINALHITVGDDLGSILDGGGEGGEGGEGGDVIGDIIGGGDDGGDSGGENEPLLDIVLGHSEVGGVVCAQQAPPPAPPLPPSGDNRTLPVTGGGIGILPAVLGLGLAGGAVGAGRLALRSRKESIK